MKAGDNYYNQILDELPLLLSKKFNGAYMPELHILRNKAEELTSHYLIFYTSDCTSRSRATQTYICQQSKTECKCESKLYIDYDQETHLATLKHIDKTHNHEFEKECYKRMRNTLTDFQREKIREANRYGITAQNLKLSLQLSCTKDVLYNIRREILHNQKVKEISNMIEEIEVHKNWSHSIITDAQNKLNALYTVHDRIVENEYAHDDIIIDDAACTNYYGLLLVALIAEDENARNDLLSLH